MSNESATPETTFGYLAMLESAEHGFFGGYLIVSLIGRPVEFHCTAPVRPSRAQKILYGATLEPFLLGEQIAGTLLDVAKLTPSLILANRDAALHVRSRSRSPMVLFCGPVAHTPEASPKPDSTALPDASSAAGVQHLHPAAAHEAFTAGSYLFQLPFGYESEQLAVTGLLAELARQVDLAEPFDRIAEAIREAQRLGSRDTETHEQAA